MPETEEQKILAEIDANKVADQEAITAGRVLYLTARAPHRGGFWDFLQEMCQVLNAMVKVRKPRRLRILVTYDCENPAPPSAQQ